MPSLLRAVVEKPQAQRQILVQAKFALVFTPIHKNEKKIKGKRYENIIP